MDRRTESWLLWREWNLVRAVEEWGVQLQDPSEESQLEMLEQAI